MKKIVTLAFFFCITFQVLAQTDGITYQAIIIGPDALELPGVDSEGNYLPNATVAIRFTIYDSGNQVEFQEVQIAETDEFGRINLLIGEANHDLFTSISWDGTPKDLEVEIDFDAGSNFEVMSREKLTFLPFAYHRNITATGTLTVDDRTYLNGELQVEGPTNLNSTLDVNNQNATNLSGSLTVEGETNLNNAFNVNNNNPSNLTGDVTVGGNTLINGTLDVIGLTTLNDLQVNGQASFGDLQAQTLVVNQSTDLLGTTLIDGMGSQVRITSNMPNTGTEMGNHPLLIDGGNNGLAIKVNGSRSNATNFITFYDDMNSSSNISWGRIEGERNTEFTNNADYNFDISSLDYDIYDAYFDVAFAAYDLAASFVEVTTASTSSTACVGLGTCVTVPIPSWIVSSTAQSIAAGLQLIAAGVGVVIAETNKDTYEDNKLELQGVTYASGAGDYAEYLLREDLNEEIAYGDIVGVKGGKISKNLTNAERMMVVSFKPIVLGNMPQANREQDYEKVAFMGQVPVKVFGKVSIGDYIIPSGKNDGVGIAVSPERISVQKIKEIVGVAWSENTQGFGLVNVAVGLNRNDNNLAIEKLETKIKEQANEIAFLKGQIESILESLSKIENGENVKLASADEENHTEHNDYEIIHSTEKEIVYFQITRDDFEKGLVMAEQMIRDSGEYERYEEYLIKLKTDIAFKEKFFNKMQSDLQNRIHYHKQVDKIGRN